MFSRQFAAIPLLFALACLAGCGDDEGGTHGPGATYTVGGQLSGLAIGDSITLRSNGADDLTLTANGDFTFGVAIADGETYDVTVLTSPPEHGCTVTHGAGTIRRGECRRHRDRLHAHAARPLLAGGKPRYGARRAQRHAAAEWQGPRGGRVRSCRRERRVV